MRNILRGGSSNNFCISLETTVCDITKLGMAIHMSIYNKWLTLYGEMQNVIPRIVHLHLSGVMFSMLASGSTCIDATWYAVTDL